MSMFVPPLEVEFIVIDYLTPSVTLKQPGGFGPLNLQFVGPENGGDWWLIDRIAVVSTPAGSRAELYAGEVADANLREVLPDGGVADEVQPIAVAGPSPVVVRFPDAGLNFVGTANLQIRLVKKRTRPTLAGL